MSLALNKPIIDFSTFKFKHSLQACTARGKNSLKFVCITTYGNHKGPTLNERSH